jgi:hypothetical protein
LIEKSKIVHSKADDFKILGVGVQFLIPTLLVIGARRKILAFSSVGSRNFPLAAEKDLTGYASPFTHWAWPYAIMVWAGFAVVMVSINFFH